ncbi:acetone carboxylase subunit gamma [Verminephrobacter eiseniae]|uniref:acetone carboxylase subunit gamma n=1 Tax=Verminephrobacter eiseniae TaxID=364317 RepID=UPI0010E3041F|nr:acetone carboxylase subunit gamma [Verminephrobacter eiseniae]KAB7631057.1 subunit of acetophenone carboxylase [Verminephrobacter sp. Larva24]MCW5234587.1 subunit of acetophenone carboxylase [Verminephrobacter eiseniae]MCW5262772.1 subunit of acetophenone carboxylase [Verminephrobacter eiseniae]MCW5293837.1 subunit of acetophenone carboxylase [Verminephrobacter eiseniae]MCW8183844.1 subunit of acetophenone carboxylase [Verminephrobacter eiseniae]
MKINMTEALAIDMDRCGWVCRKCGHEHGPAEQNYKQGLLVYARDPRQVHQAIIDPQQYAQTFAPQPEWVRIIEYYCPQCALLVEAEYLPPGHPPVHDMQFDLASLRALAARIQGAAQ